MASVPGWSGPPVTASQQQLLFALVEWERAGEDEFMLVSTMRTRHFVKHASVPVRQSDVEQLAAKGYLYVRAPRGTLIASVTAEGHAYYEAHQGAQHPAELLASQVRQYVDTSAMGVYPDADALLREAAQRLWAARRDAEVEDVGDKCRDAIQSFAQTYYQRFYPRASEEPVPREKTVDAVSKVFRHLQATRGEKDTTFANAMFGFWQALIGQVQKVVHGSEQRDRPLRWDDGQRIVLHTYLLIGELHRYATGEHIG
jgi:hypothetical protein